MSRGFKTTLVGLAALGFLIGSAATTLAGPQAPDPSACGLPRNTPVVASFDAKPARGIWQRLPALARSPELEEVTGTARVLVLGDVAAPPMAGAFGAVRPTRLPNAVCVILPDGPILYYNVSRQGFNAP